MLSLILQLIILLILLVVKIKLSKEDIVFLYKDLKKYIDKREIIKVTFINICIGLGGSKLIISFLYFIDQSMVNTFIYESNYLMGSFEKYLLNGLLLIIISSIIDEIIFRGTIFNVITRRFNLYAGIIVSSIIYSSFYAGSGISGALALGIINCILYVKYKNILINILLNFINHFIIFISVLILGNNKNSIVISYNTIFINIILGIIFCIGGIYLLIKFMNENSEILIKYDKHIKSEK